MGGLGASSLILGVLSIFIVLRYCGPFIYVCLLLRSQLNAKIMFRYFKTSCQNNGNESAFVKYLSRKCGFLAFSCDRNNIRIVLGVGPRV